MKDIDVVSRYIDPLINKKNFVTPFDIRDNDIRQHSSAYNCD